MTASERACLRCGGSMHLRNHGAKYCSRRCAGEQHRLRYEPRHVPYEVPSGTIGAIAELMVAADLMKRGYEVFRALSPSCSCDLAILKNGRLLRIEVRTAHRIPRGLVWARNKSTEDRHDHYALVLHSENLVTYEPELPLSDAVSVRPRAMSDEDSNQVLEGEADIPDRDPEIE